MTESPFTGTVRIGISSCLLGANVRYDGGNKRDPYLINTLGQFVEWVPVCPEVESGLPVPREPLQLVGDLEIRRLLTIDTRMDYTGPMRKWTREKLAELEKIELCGFIFKSRSPSCGLRGVEVCNQEGVSGNVGIGIFAYAFKKKFPLRPAEDDERLHDPDVMRKFIKRAFVIKSA